MRYQYTLAWREDLHRSREDARGYLKEILVEIEGLSDSSFEIVTFDVQSVPTPHKAGADTVIHHNDPVTPLGVTHPWDQGLWIFPADHPFAPYERLVRDADHDGKNQTEEWEAQKFALLEAGQKMLNP